MPKRLHRYYGAGYLHFITTSRYQRSPWLGSGHNRDLLLRVLEQVRRRYDFVVVGYVVMPEHVHLLLSEPERANPSIVMQALKQGFARRLLRRLRDASHPRQGRLWNAAVNQGHIWQRRFYDFVVWTEHKRVEKLCYMHRNPVKRGLVLEPDQWRFAPMPTERQVRSWSTSRRRQSSKCECRYEVEVRASHPSKSAKGGAANCGGRFNRLDVSLN
jgi:putative transposase